MIDKRILRKLSDFVWEIPKSYRSDMRVPARVYSSEMLLDTLFSDRTLEQLVNMTTLPGIVNWAIAMPDAHEGYGFPIGGVAATEYPDGAISPGGIGYDINCGVRLIKSPFTSAQLRPYLEQLLHTMYQDIPSGLGKSGQWSFNKKTLDMILAQGCLWAQREGFAQTSDLDAIESHGSLTHADPANVSDRAKERGKDQLGTMGAGNHFVEIDEVMDIVNTQAASAFGLFKHQVVILIHMGSRGLGHQVATDYIRIMENHQDDYQYVLPDPELAAAPFCSTQGKNYFGAMAAAANFAWVNRQLITYLVRQSWKKVLNIDPEALHILYDVAHNIAKIEEHDKAGKKQTVIVHRKGATRAFGPNHPEIPDTYRSVGQPVIIPGSMGTASYVLVGTGKADNETFASSCHGAGRRISRHQAVKQLNTQSVTQALKKAGILTRTGSARGLVEEAPQAYKDIDSVVHIVDGAGIANIVVKLKPLAVFKG